MQDVEKYQKWLSDKDLRVIAARSGVPYATLWHIKTGKTKRTTDFVAAELDAVMNCPR